MPLSLLHANVLLSLDQMKPISRTLSTKKLKKKKEKKRHSVEILLCSSAYNRQKMGQRNGVFMQNGPPSMQAS